MKHYLIPITGEEVKRIEQENAVSLVREELPPGLKEDEPFFGLLYGGKGCTRDEKGKVLGEFICAKMYRIWPYLYNGGDAAREPWALVNVCAPKKENYDILSKTGMSNKEILEYIGDGETGYIFESPHIWMYDVPEELSEYGAKTPSKREEFAPLKNWQRMFTVEERKPVLGRDIIFITKNGEQRFGKAVPAPDDKDRIMFRTADFAKLEYYFPEGVICWGY